MKIPYEIQKQALRLGIVHPRKQQVQAIKALLDGNDVLLIAPTAFGKSAVAQIAGLVRNRLTIVVEPTISLLADQVQKLQELGLSAAYLSHANHSEHSSILQQAKDDSLAFLYLTPEQLLAKRKELCRLHPWLLVVDEAHCVLDWGCSFRPAYLEIDRFLSQFKKRPVVLAMTATAPRPYRDIIQALLSLRPDTQTIRCSLDKPALSLIRCKIDDPGKDEHRKQKKLLAYLKKYGGEGSAVVYCATQAKAAEVCNFLDAQYPGRVTKCYSSMSQKRREKQELQFMEGSHQIMVATAAFGMGVSKRDLRLVIHYNFPLSILDYYQQVGRAGRDGQKAHAVVFYDPADLKINQYLIGKTENPSVRKWQEGQLKQMIDFLENEEDCMMRQVLRALGENRPKRCKHCTNCQKRG